MILKSMEQTGKLMEMMWGNWENGIKKVYDSQQEFVGKNPIDVFKKQQDIFNSITTNLFTVEEEVKDSLNNISASIKESCSNINNKDAALLFENWNEKMTNIINRIQQLSVTPSKSLLTMVERSQERMYESVKKVTEEQNTMQSETREIIENFMSHVKKSQESLVSIMGEQTNQTLNEFPPKVKVTFGMGERESQHSKLIEKSKTITDRPFEEISIGVTATYIRKVTNQDILDFATLTDDVNPIHIDEEFAANSMFKGRIAHGILTVGFISTLIGTILPGKNVIYLSQNCKFTAPVRIGDTLRIVGEVISKRPDKKIMTIQTNVYNQRDEMVLEGSAVVMKKEQI